MVPNPLVRGTLKGLSTWYSEGFECVVPKGLSTWYSEGFGATYSEGFGTWYSEGFGTWYQRVQSTWYSKGLVRGTLKYVVPKGFSGTPRTKGSRVRGTLKGLSAWYSEGFPTWYSEGFGTWYSLKGTTYKPSRVRGTLKGTKPSRVPRTLKGLVRGTLKYHVPNPLVPRT